MNTQRLTQMRELMEQQDIDQLILSDPSTIFYLTGQWFSPGERMLVLLISRQDEEMLFLNELFPLLADPGVPVQRFRDTDDYVGLVSQSLSGNSIAIDKNWPARFLLPLMEQNRQRQFILGSIVADEARLIKDEEEQERMRRSSNLNDAAMTLIAREVKSGITEAELADKLSRIYQDLGAEGMSFPPIIAFGSHGADPHHETDQTVLKSGDSIIFDIGCLKDSYASDMTRTYFFNEVSEEAREVYETVKEANLRAIARVRPGITFAEVDEAARSYIESQGYGDYFTHRTGHGIGIDIHEPEDVSSVNHHPLRPGMIFSIEPGIYLPGRFGVRIEDLVLVTEDGCEVLNEVTKDLTLLHAGEEA